MQGVATLIEKLGPKSGAYFSVVTKSTQQVMFTDTIKEVKIDDQGRLCVYPAKKSFEFIWRCAAEVNWDPSGKFLYSPKPREWSYADWFDNIILCVKYEYGCLLQLVQDTVWTNVSADLKAVIQADRIT
jgi:hypothetical protein